jgi:hypothetical protein
MTLFRGSLVVLVVSLLAGCASESDKIGAITAVNRQFKQRYEVVLAEHGSRTFNASRQQAIAAMKSTLLSMDMAVSNDDSEMGYLRVFAPAPLPLSKEEWQAATSTDGPWMRQIIAEHVGIVGHFVKFEPQGLDVVITATAVETSPKTKVSLTMRLQETQPPRSGWPRREYPPPSAVKIGLDKIWARFERELKVAQGAA